MSVVDLYFLPVSMYSIIIYQWSYFPKQLYEYHGCKNHCEFNIRSSNKIEFINSKKSGAQKPAAFCLGYANTLR